MTSRTRRSEEFSFAVIAETGFPTQSRGSIFARFVRSWKGRRWAASTKPPVRIKVQIPRFDFVLLLS